MIKKWTSYVSAFAAAAVLLFAGCSNITSGEFFEENTSSVSANKAEKFVVATINGIDSVESMRSQISSGRTVLPTPQAVTGDAANGLIFVLEGTSSLGNTIAAQKVTVSADSAAGTGTLKISLPDTSVWELTLTAYKTDGDTGVQSKTYTDNSGSTPAEKTASDPVLTATTEVNFAYGTPAPVFNMNVKGLETPGNVKITTTSGFKYKKTSVVITKYEIGLYDLVTGAQIKNKAASPADATTGKLSVATGDFEGSATEKTVNFTANETALANVAPGEYVLGVTFYNTYGTGTSATDFQVGYWSDYVVVAPGQTTDFTTVITGIDEKPADPTNFKATFVEDLADSSKYLAKLDWTDEGSTACNYEIDLYEVKDTAKDTALTTETIKVSSNATKLATLGFKTHYTGTAADDIVDFNDGSIYYGGGSLFASSKTATLKLDTGKLYEVVLRAVKSATDKSNDVVRAAADEGSSDDDFTVANHISRTCITYISKPYTITKDTSVGQAYVEYKTYKGADIDLITTDDFSLSYKGTALTTAELADRFKGWVNIETPEAAAETKISDYKDVTLLAKVETEITGTAETYAYDTTALTKSFVSLTLTSKAADGTPGTATIDDDTNIATVNATTYKTITVAVADTAAADYSDFTISVDGTLYAHKKSCELPLSIFETGTHNIVVSGQKSTGTGNTGVTTRYSYSFTLKVTR